jgi:hypothetical protein
MEPAMYEDIVSRLRAHGYETDRLVKTLQPG